MHSASGYEILFDIFVLPDVMYIPITWVLQGDYGIGYTEYNNVVVGIF